MILSGGLLVGRHEGGVGQSDKFVRRVAEQGSNAGAERNKAAGRIQFVDDVVAGLDELALALLRMAQGHFQMAGFDGVRDAVEEFCKKDRRLFREKKSMSA